MTKQRQCDRWLDQREVLQRASAQMRAAKSGTVGDDDHWGHGYNAGVKRCLGIIARLSRSVSAVKP